MLASVYFIRFFCVFFHFSLLIKMYGVLHCKALVILNIMSYFLIINLIFYGFICYISNMIFSLNSSIFVLTLKLNLIGTFNPFNMKTMINLIILNFIIFVTQRYPYLFLLWPYFPTKWEIRKNTKDHKHHHSH